MVDIDGPIKTKL